MMNPVALAENHPLCRTNREGERVLPNGQVWIPQLLLLCFASQDPHRGERAAQPYRSKTPRPPRPRRQQQKVPPLPFLLSSRSSRRAASRCKLDGGDDERLRRRVRRRRPRRAVARTTSRRTSRRIAQRRRSRSRCRRPTPRFPPSFDGANPRAPLPLPRARQSQWMVRPIVEAHGWDHESGDRGLLLSTRGSCSATPSPGRLSGQLAKDKKDSNVGFEGQISSVAHTRKLVTTAGVDVQTVGKQLAYTARAETRWKFCAVEQESPPASSPRPSSAARSRSAPSSRIRWKVTPGAKLVVSAGAVSAPTRTSRTAATAKRRFCGTRDDPSNPNSQHRGHELHELARRRRARRETPCRSVTLGKDTQLTARANSELARRGAARRSAPPPTSACSSRGSGWCRILCALIGRVQRETDVMRLNRRNKREEGKCSTNTQHETHDVAREARRRGVIRALVIRRDDAARLDVHALSFATRPSVRSNPFYGIQSLY